MANETYELIVSGKLAGQFVQNVLHVGIDNTGATDPFVIATAILTKFNTSGQFVDKWTDMLPAAYTLTSLRCRKILPTGGPTNIILQGSLVSDTGARSPGIGVATTSPLIIWLTALRPNKPGRTFIPGVAEDDLDGGVLSGALLTAMGSFATYWGNGGTLTSPAYSWDGQVYRRAIAAGDAISNYRVSPIIGNQRRRELPV